MIQNLPAGGVIRIHVDPESISTSFEGFTANTFKGVATLTTPAGPFKMEGTRWHLLSQVFSSPEDMKTDLYKERLLQRNHGQGPQLQVVFLEGSSAGQTSSWCYDLHRRHGAHSTSFL